ncbi:MAG: hypothetical protein CMH25_05420 [Micavibrio sp.]|nr:hypothetical protein [Micavibrio sp.]
MVLIVAITVNVGYFLHYVLRTYSTFGFLMKLTIAIIGFLLIAYSNYAHAISLSKEDFNMSSAEYYTLCNPQDLKSDKGKSSLEKCRDFTVVSIDSFSEALNEKEGVNCNAREDFSLESLVELINDHSELIENNPEYLNEKAVKTLLLQYLKNEHCGKIKEGNALYDFWKKGMTKWLGTMTFGIVGE